MAVIVMVMLLPRCLCTQNWSPSSKRYLTPHLPTSSLPTSLHLFLYPPSLLPPSSHTETCTSTLLAPGPPSALPTSTSYFSFPPFLLSSLLPLPNSLLSLPLSTSLLPFLPPLSILTSYLARVVCCPPSHGHWSCLQCPAET